MAATPFTLPGLLQTLLLPIIMSCLIAIIAASPSGNYITAETGSVENPHSEESRIFVEEASEPINEPHQQQYAQIRILPDYRPTLFFRESWREIPFATPITQEHVANEDLLLSLHGPGAENIRKSHHSRPVDDPYYVWSGLCEGNWAVSLKNRDYYVDLRGYAKIKWRSKQSGLRKLHIILKLADGSWLVSDQYDGSSDDWRIREFNLMDITWYELDIERVVEGRKVTNPNLTMVDEIGFTDLMRGGRTNASSRLDWIEVHGRKVHR